MATIDLTRSDFLYHLLESCSNEELHYLVKTLVESSASVLSMTRGYEINQPDHQRYSDLIADEVHRVAAKVLAKGINIRPSYVEMVNGLCKQIGFTALTEVGESESVLLNLFAKSHILSVSPNKRRDLIAEASQAAAKAAGSWLVDEWKPFAAVLLYIMFLRREHEERAGASTSASLPSTLCVQSEEGDAILSVSSLGSVGEQACRTATLANQAAATLSPLLAALEPILSTDQLLAHGNFVRVSIPPNARLDRIAGASAFFGSARDATGKFCSIRLDPVSALTLASPLALVTVAQAIADQKRQEQIERSLEEIKSLVTDVARFQKAERRAVLTGSIRYFQQIAESVLGGELEDVVLREIERHEVELTRIQEHLIAELKLSIEAFRAIKNDSWTSGKFIKALIEAQAVITEIFEGLSICLRARACGYQLMCAFPGREKGKQRRLADICEALDRLCPDSEVAIELDQILRDKMTGVSAFDMKALLLRNESKIFEQCLASRNSMIEALTSPEKDLVGGDIVIDVRLEDGLPVEMRLA